MPGRLDGFYVAKYEGLNPDGRWGFGTVFLKDGKIYGGDNLSFFIGEFSDQGDVVVAKVKVWPLGERYHSVTDIDDKPWDLEDIRGQVETGALPPNIHLQLFGQRYDKEHAALSIELWRVVPF